MKALILGIGGQDASYLAEFLLSKGYEVHGVYRRSSVDNLVRIRHIKDKLNLYVGDLSDHGSIHSVIDTVRPDELYNLADQDHVGTSFHTPSFNADITYGAVGKILESVRNVDRRIRVFQPCSATMFGMTPPPQNEESPHDPRSPYAVAKTGAYHLSRFYRNHYGLFVSTGILFNHDSPRRGRDYLLHRIVTGVLAVVRGKASSLSMANLDLRVDIGYAGEFVESFWRLLQLDKPTDVCIGTGNALSVKEMVLYCASKVGFQKEEVDHWLLESGDTEEPRLRCDPYLTVSQLRWCPKLGSPQVIDMLISHYGGKSCG